MSLASRPQFVSVLLLTLILLLLVPACRRARSGQDEVAAPGEAGVAAGISTMQEERQESEEGAGVGQTLYLDDGTTDERQAGQPSGVSGDSDAAAARAVLPSTYTVQPGDTLSTIAGNLNVPLEELLRANGLTDPNTIYAGQVLQLPGVAAASAPAAYAPADLLLPDSEVIFSPAYKEFDIRAVARRGRGYLARHREVVEGKDRTGVEIVDMVAKRFSVGPRVLLALLEMQSGWVTDRSPVEREFPMGQRAGGRNGLFLQLSWAANQLNTGYYGYLLGRQDAMTFADGSRMKFAAETNPGTAAIQNVISQLVPPDRFEEALGQEGFLGVYNRLFEDPWKYEVTPLVPSDLTQPPFRLPWEAGETWYYTGGPHGGWGEGAARAALDFVPSTNTGCYPAPEWGLAVADGLVVRSENGELVLDLDGDGFIGTGWTVLYMHIAEDGRAPVGARLRAGDRIGHPSCEGGFSDATHMHIARRYNGQWMQADVEPAFVMDGWEAVAWPRSYDGELVRGERRLEACACREDAVNAVTAP